MKTLLSDLFKKNCYIFIKMTDVISYTVCYFFLVTIVLVLKIVSRSKIVRNCTVFLHDFEFDYNLARNRLDFEATEYFHPGFSHVYLVRTSSDATSVNRMGSRVVGVNISIPSFSLMKCWLPHTRRIILDVIGLCAVSRMINRLNPVAIECLTPNRICIRLGLIKFIHGVLMISQSRGNGTLRRAMTGHPIVFPVITKHPFLSIVAGVWDDLVLRLFYSNCDLVLGYNVNNMQEAISHGADPLKTHLLRIRLYETALENPILDKAQLKGIPSNGTIISLWSRLEPQKYVYEALESTLSCIKNNQNLHFIIIGTGSMLHKMERLVNESRLSEQVHFLGYKSLEFIRSVAAHSKVAVVPLGGSSLVEAARLEVPIVAYDIEWHNEFVRPGETGLLADISIPSSLSVQIEKLINNEDEAKVMACHAKKLANVMFDPKAIDKREKEIFEQFFLSKVKPRLT